MESARSRFQYFPQCPWEDEIAIRSLVALLWLIACGVLLAIATFRPGLLSQLGDNSTFIGNTWGKNFFTVLAVSLPAALLLCGRYNHGLRDGVLFLIAVLLIVMANYTHRIASTPLRLQHVGAIVSAVVIAELTARLLGYWLDAPEVRSARKGLANGGRKESRRKSSRRSSEPD